MKGIFFFSILFSCTSFANGPFSYPLVGGENIESYAKKISIKRNKYETLRKIDRFRKESKKIKGILVNKPHEKVIDSISAYEGPQISTVAMSDDEVTPFYANFFREKIFIQKQIEGNWKDRAFQRLIQFRHQNEAGNSQIGNL